MVCLQVLSSRGVNSSLEALVLRELADHGYSGPTDPCLLQTFELGSLERVLLELGTRLRTIFLTGMISKTSVKVRPCVCVCVCVCGCVLSKGVPNLFCVPSAGNRWSTIWIVRIPHPTPPPTSLPELGSLPRPGGVRPGPEQGRDRAARPQQLHRRIQPEAGGPDPRARDEGPRLHLPQREPPPAVGLRAGGAETFLPTGHMGILGNKK